jgi:hypothetical protein
MSPCLHVSILHVSMFMSPHFRNSANGKRNLRRTATSVCFLKTENGNGKLPFVCCKRKQKWTFVFLSRQVINSTMIAVLANVPIYGSNPSGMYCHSLKYSVSESHGCLLADIHVCALWDKCLKHGHLLSTELDGIAMSWLMLILPSKSYKLTIFFVSG